MFEAFPIGQREKVRIVLNIMSKYTYREKNVWVSENSCSYRLLDGTFITFPYRIYDLDEGEKDIAFLNFEQKMIYHAMYTRSCDGYTRARHYFYLEVVGNTISITITRQKSMTEEITRIV